MARDHKVPQHAVLGWEPRDMMPHGRRAYFLRWRWETHAYSRDFLTAGVVSMPEGETQWRASMWIGQPPAQTAYFDDLEEAKAWLLAMVMLED